MVKVKTLKLLVLINYYKVKNTNISFVCIRSQNSMFNYNTHGPKNKPYCLKYNP